MLDALDITNDELVLDIGCGLGYSSAVMARMAEAVVAVEDDEEMVEDAQTILAEQGADNVIMHHGTLGDGASQHGPYDVILVQGGVEQLPATLLDQLKDGGRIVCLFMEGSLGTVRVGIKAAGRISWRYAFNASAPVLPAFCAECAFSL